MKFKIALLALAIVLGGCSKSEKELQYEVARVKAAQAIQSGQIADITHQTEIVCVGGVQFYQIHKLNH